jgi:hypothetical protein
MQTSQNADASDGPGLFKTMGDTRNDVYQRLNDAVAERGCVNDHPIGFSPLLSGRKLEGNY